MKIQLSEHFTYEKLLRFTLPSIVMMVFSSVYGVVDGVFVSNFVGKTAFTASVGVGAVLLLPLIRNINGVWMSILVAEFMAVVIALIFFVEKRKKYRY